MSFSLRSCARLTPRLWPRRRASSPGPAAPPARPARRPRSRRRRRQRQVGQQREPDASQLHVAGGHRALALRLLQQQPRIRQLELRRQPLAIAQLGDLVGPLAPAARCPPSTSQAARALASSSRVEASSSAASSCVSWSRARLSTRSRARRQLVCLEPAAGEDRHRTRPHRRSSWCGTRPQRGKPE